MSEEPEGRRGCRDTDCGILCVLCRGRASPYTRCRTMHRSPARDSSLLPGFHIRAGVVDTVGRSGDDWPSFAESCLKTGNVRGQTPDDLPCPSSLHGGQKQGAWGASPSNHPLFRQVLIPQRGLAIRPYQTAASSSDDHTQSTILPLCHSQTG